MSLIQPIKNNWPNHQKKSGRETKIVQKKLAIPMCVYSGLEIRKKVHKKFVKSISRNFF